MAHYSSKKRREQFKSVAPNSEINVTPLVDVVLVLLIIFMVVTPLLERDLQVRVPQTDEAATETSSAQQVVVGITPEGNFMINLEFVDAAEYSGRLKEILNARDDKTVFFMAEDSANYESLVTALDGAKEAGAQILGMMTDAPQVPPTPPPPAPESPPEGATPAENPGPEGASAPQPE